MPPWAPVPALAPPNAPRNPPTHPFGPGELIEIDRAVTAPVLSAGPIAWTHLPTARSDGEAGSSTSNVVDAVVVTVTWAVAEVRGSVAVTVMTSPLTEAT